jgi:hypothetical protein
VASFSPPSFVWSQVARVKVLQSRIRTEVSTAAQVGGPVSLLLAAIHSLGRPQHIWVPGRKILSTGTLAMAPVAISRHIDEVTAQPNQASILPMHVEMNRRRLESYFDLALILIVFGLLVSSNADRLE